MEVTRQRGSASVSSVNSDLRICVVVPPVSGPCDLEAAGVGGDAGSRGCACDQVAGTWVWWKKAGCTVRAGGPGG